MTGEPHDWQKAGMASKCRKTETHAPFVQVAFRKDIPAILNV